MEELIYTKYSNERCREFALRTDIYEDEENRRFVQKTALYPEGRPHVDKLAMWSVLLSESYQELDFACSKCTKTKDGVRLEYIFGETLEERLDGLLEAGKKEAAWEMLSDYVLRIKKLHDKKPFAVTEEFKKVFGDVKLPDDLTCTDITNIDMVCGNVILTNPRMVLDYEWVFDFPVPCQFVLYRIIQYYIEGHPMRKVLNGQALYKALGIHPEMQETFRKMEENFQDYITQGHIPMRVMFPSMTPGTVEDQNKALTNEVAVLRAKLEQRENLIKEMRSTKVWRLYRKYRSLVERKK